jgi:predicted nucleic acid-binding Zn ribbon protein
VGGDPVTWRPSRPPRAEIDPQGLAPSLSRLAARFGLAPPSLLGRVFAHWEELVGPDVAAHARPTSLRDGVLTVTVDHPAWATSLRMLSADLLARLREQSGCDEARELVVHVGGGASRPSGAERRAPDPGSRRAPGGRGRRRDS